MSSAENVMDQDPDTRSLWQKFRLPIVLGALAFCLYLFSIAWIVYGQGQAL